MRSLYLATAALLALTAAQALAQVPAPPDLATGARPGHAAGVGESLPRSDHASNIGAADTRSAIAPTLPTTVLRAEAGARDYLNAARASLLAGRTGAAQQSLEMAETRALDRSVPQGQGGTPSGSLLVAQIRDALHALGGGDRPHALRLIDQALAG
jgi:hypothetical protein